MVTCKICGRAVSSDKYLKVHLKTHDGTHGNLKTDWLNVARRLYPKLIFPNQVLGGDGNQRIQFICPKHGPGAITKSSLRNTPNHRIGCQKCKGEIQLLNPKTREKAVNTQSIQRAISREDWIARFRLRHGDWFNYDLVPSWIPSEVKIKIVCPLHGEFEQTPYRHSVSDCLDCSRNRIAAKLFLSSLGEDPEQWSDSCLRELGQKVRLERLLVKLPKLLTLDSRRSKAALRALNAMIQLSKGAC